MIRKTLFATLAVFALAANANAAVIFDFVLDPGTTAGGGATSTQTGAGRWHLYAYDNTVGSAGIAAYNIVVENALTLLHRSPATPYQDADENDGDAGFRLLRSANNAMTMVGSQPLLGNPTQLTGFGREASSFTAKLPAGSTLFLPTVSPSWGANVTKPSIDSSLPWLFMSEGTYTVGGNLPTIGAGTNVNLYGANFSQFAATTCNVDGVEDCGLGDTQVATPPSVQDLLIDDVNASVPGQVSGTVTQTGGTEPITWGGFSFVSFTPSHGALVATGTAEAGNANFATDTQLFAWDTVGAPRGTYTWSVTADNTAAGAGGGADSGLITVNVTAVPEPATFALVGIALVGLVGIRRRS